MRQLTHVVCPACFLGQFCNCTFIRKCLCTDDHNCQKILNILSLQLLPDPTSHPCTLNLSYSVALIFFFSFLLSNVFVCVCVLVYVGARVCRCVRVCGGQRMISNVIPPFYLWRRSSLSGRPAWCLPLPSTGPTSGRVNGWINKRLPPHQAFLSYVGSEDRTLHAFTRQALS